MIVIQNNLHKQNFWIKLLPLLLLVFFCGNAAQAQTQKKPKVVQLTGLVTAGDSLYGVIGAGIYVPQTGRGTTTNRYGYFSLPVLAGDSVVFKALSYQQQYIIIPENYTGDSYSVIVQMEENVATLPAVQVFPYPTEQMFKEAFLALELETDEEENAKKNLHERVLKRLFDETPMDASMNASYIHNLQQQDLQRRHGGIVTNPLLNPFAWLKLIQQAKDGEFKRDR